MSDYRYPYQDGVFVLNQLVGLEQICQQAGLDDFADGLAEAVLDEAAKLGSEQLAPLNVTGDRLGASIENNNVSETPGFSDAYQQFCDGGWPSLAGNPEFGGQGLPNVLAVAVNEVWQSANLAWALCPLLTQGAIEAIETHGNDQLKKHYLPKLISGEWTGTMNLTEPDAGTDLAALKSKAVPEDDYYRITGQKIFITWGDHQMTDNIVHLVLARLPDAPAGVKGISLFVVPKYLLDENGNPTEQRNDAYAVSLEHKLGIHGSPTCVMSFGDNGGAIGYLVGKANQGLACMFTMMNDARQGVGLQGLAISERSYQHAVTYAKERIQGTLRDGSRISIIKHPDVRRMLLQMKSSIQAMRALVYVARAESDYVNNAVDDETKLKHQKRNDLLTPIVKGWVTELAQELTYLAVQIHGGMGFIEETGVAQYYRDARILTIYEGTTGIQALDLIGRKTLVDGGDAVTDLLSEISSDLKEIDHPELQDIVSATQAAVEQASIAKQWVLEVAAKDASAAGSASVSYMMLMGYLCGAWLLTKSAAIAQENLSKEGANNDFLNAKIISARFFTEQMLPRVSSLLVAMQSGGETVMAMSEEQF
ncbi:acyl-CoA dehydrogenase [Neptuniibacter sp. 2_MG-2023]|uniref:acyl-CoA dehydrogenase n=1 Tax=Neptuniibacter sp. 2_MG-2023 TaxID=3062671 RepID=UPI0026E2CAAB|nr:acyl-CoA dehydrogenase [Neptuniibacter sp. 2_MG-2023]MDO6515424.1 acyl-CoA dehydrogenase [Neptuniibacter sp. 2_MG-2023]